MDQQTVEQIHGTAVAKGFWDSQVGSDRGLVSNYIPIEEYERKTFEFFAKQYMMIVSEVSELMEAMRKEKGHAEIESEAADIFIRLADVYEGLRERAYVSITLAEAVENKTGINVERPRLHGVLG